MHAKNLLCDEYSNTVLFGRLFYLILRNRNSLLKYSGNDHFNFSYTGMKAVQRKKKIIKYSIYY